MIVDYKSINPKTILNTYDKVIVFFSGGKDSLACLLYLIFELKVPRHMIEVHHHDIDGSIERPDLNDYNRGRVLWDWEVTVDYCRKVCEELGVAFYLSYREGGIEAEMTRNNSWTGRIHWQNPDGTWGTNNPRRYNSKGEKTFLGTRMRVAQISPDLSRRWCSASAKIDVGDSLIRNSKRFNYKRVLVVSGERAEESPNRARYNEFEADRTHSNYKSDKPKKDENGKIILKNGKPIYPYIKQCIPNFETCDRKNHVDRWRPVLKWSQAEVWAIIKKYKIVPHPAYYLGWGRLSCRNCIFGSHNQWATSHLIAPEQVLILADYEETFGQFHLDNCRKENCKVCVNISKRDIPAYTIHRIHSIRERIKIGTPYDLEGMEETIALATSEEYYGDITTDNWTEPNGMWGEVCGPT